VRFYHWVTVVSLTLLVATGLVIGRPPALISGGDAMSSYWFGWVRFLHFASGYVFLFAFLIRVYWLFAGNRYARWERFLFRPLEALEIVKVDIVQIQKRPSVDRLGHNTLAASSYALVFLATVFQVATGFALYAAMSGAWLPQMFAWIVPLMGGDASVRQWHHIATWFFVLFTLVHVYLAIYHDVVEGHGEISSMVSGVRFVKK
jgi:Ni/Fe-hydrogenase 1 B-type cytochrome subunit